MAMLSRIREENRLADRATGFTRRGEPLMPEDPQERAAGASVRPSRATPMSLGGLRAWLIEIDFVSLPACLTASERSIVALLLDGLNGAELAAKRGRSYRTIANQLAMIYRKCGVNSRQELVARLSRMEIEARAPTSKRPR